MAVLAAAQLLDELMGRHRNTNPNETAHRLNWEDPEYCMYYMVRFCPHDLFVNTRADLGACARIHDDEAKSMYEKAEPCYKKSHYQEEFMRLCQNLINDVERKIEKGKQRLILMNSAPDPNAQANAQAEKDQERIKALTAQIGTLEKDAEAAGMRGDVDQAQKIMKTCDKLKEEIESVNKQTENNHWNATAELAAAQEKQMEVCPVCAAFLIVGDAQQRIDDHLTGKQHVGYYKLRQAFEEMNAEREKLREEKEKRRREEREKEREKERGGRDRDRGDRDNRDRQRRDRRDNRHSRDRNDREERSKDRDRDERSRSHRSNRDDKSRDDKSRDDKSRDDKSRDDKSRDDKNRDDKSSSRRDGDKDKDRRHRSDRGGRDHHDSSRRHRSRSRGRSNR